MIKTKEQAIQVQARRIATGRIGTARAVGRFVSKVARKSGHNFYYARRSLLNEIVYRANREVNPDYPESLGGKD